MFVSFLWGMLHLVCACLTSGLCWAILGYVSAMLGSCWTISVYLGPSWDHIGFLSWATLGHAGTILGSCWAILGYIGLMLSHFGLFWELFCLCKAFARNTVNTSKKYTFWSRCWWSLLPFLGYVCFFPSGYAAISLCLPDLGLMLDHSGLCQRHVGMCWARVGTILALSWAILGYVGTFSATLGAYWACVESF